MKVLDNLENYDIPKGYHLNAEQEDELARIVKEVVDALIPLRSSKRETRKYFSQHLRYSSNMFDQMKEPDYPKDEYETGQHYKPIEGEYLWDSNLLHPVLISLLEQDKQSFGYILNLLNEDMKMRNGEQNWFWAPVSDNAVKYALKFDIEEIRAKVEELPTYKEKLDYLNKVKCDVNLFDGIDRDEYDEFGQAFEYRLGKLTEAVQTEYEIWGDKKSTDEGPATVEAKQSEQAEITLTPHQATEERLSGEGAILSDVYFSPEVMATGQYDDLDFKLSYNEQIRQKRHIKDFEKVLQSYFENCYIEDDGVRLNEETLKESTKLIDDLFDDYTNRLDKICTDNPDEIRKKITEWLRVTARCILGVHTKNRVFRPKDDIDETTGYPRGTEYQTDVLRDALLDQAYDSYLKSGCMYFGRVDNTLKNVMPYNLWGGRYDQDFGENFGQVALSDENRAKVFLKANKEWLTKEIKSCCDTYYLDCSLELPFGDPGEPRYDPNKHMPKFLQGLFSDYVRRVNNATRDSKIAHDAFQIWVFDLMTLINDLYQEESARLSECEYDTSKSASLCHFYYIGCSLPILLKILLNYYSDYEEVSKITDKDGEANALEEAPVATGTSELPQSVELSGKEKPVHKDILGEALCYKYKDDILFNQLLQFMLRATEDSAATLSRELINETFDVISAEFDKYLMTTDVLTEDRINVLFMCFDHWFDTFKDLADDVFSTCQQTLRPKTRKKSDAEVARIKEKKAQSMAMFIIEKAMLTVSDYKANILYNHQYFEQVFYNINGWNKERILSERERLEDAFGAGRERDILFDKDSNIEAFYEELVDIVRKGLLEVHSTADTMDEEERLETYHALLKGLIDFDLPMYIDLVKMERDFSTETYHSATSWVETTKYCLYQVLIESERRIAEDEGLSVEIDYTFFQKSNFTFIPNMFTEALAEYESSTGNIEIDEKLNHLGERDEDEWDCKVPAFDSSLLGDDFITEEDLGIRYVEEPAPELSGEITQEIPPQAPLVAVIYDKPKGNSVETEKESALKYIKSIVNDSRNAEYILEFFTEHLCGAEGDRAFIYIEAAIQAKAINRPRYKDITKIFGWIGKENNYNKQIGKKKEAWFTDIEVIKDEIESKLAK